MIYKTTAENNTMFFLRPITKEECTEIAALCDQCVGENLYSRETIENTIGTTDHFFYLLETEDGKIIGYIYYRLSDLTDVAESARLDAAILRGVQRRKSDTVGKIQSVGIIEEYRKMGLAVQMIRFALKELKSKAVDIVYIVCWKRGQTVPLKRSMQECEFVFLCESERVWYNEERLICPHCGGRCECSAEIYYKELI